MLPYRHRLVRQGGILYEAWYEAGIDEPQESVKGAALPVLNANAQRGHAAFGRIRRSGNQSAASHPILQWVAPFQRRKPIIAERALTTFSILSCHKLRSSYPQKVPSASAHSPRHPITFASAPGQEGRPTGNPAGMANSQARLHHQPIGTPRPRRAALCSHWRQFPAGDRRGAG